MEEPTLNAHNKDEFPPAHTAEHILNQTMVRTFGCARWRINHIERKKSKCNYDLDFCPTDEKIRAVEAKVNEMGKITNVTGSFWQRTGDLWYYFAEDSDCK